MPRKASFHSLPWELIAAVFAFLPAPTLATNAPLTCRRCYAVASTIPLPIDLEITLITTRTTSPPFGTQLLPPPLHAPIPARAIRQIKSSFALHARVWVDASDSMWSADGAVGAIAGRVSGALEARAGGRKMRVCVSLVVDRVRDESSYVNGTDTEAGRRAALLTAALAAPAVEIHNPATDVLVRVPPRTDELALVGVHGRVIFNAAGALSSLRALHLRSDGRILDASGHVRVSDLAALREVRGTLEILEFEGPWMADMVNNPRAFIDVLKGLVGLVKLDVDFDVFFPHVERVVGLVRVLPKV
ncbi:hypothetical protein BDK51DRAFT_41947 [Blyttiomyces helicus]|uniref:F-box domain-containing protein n=1 Tax=Blyttiomyces helicus TaxID=388810 RepID=A0A4P9WG56_9FUNG|nr:hypothetical protein BDK51DRAFT_41947 [Blyttiomyces helicus]|eukprot:RKO90010.1 hypothetical protein BDK51DRAFT_41947 [Blyttiomyces helicus]